MKTVIAKLRPKVKISCFFSPNLFLCSNMNSPFLRTESPIPLGKKAEEDSCRSRVFFSFLKLLHVGSLSQLTNSRPLHPTRCIHTISQEDNNSVLSLVASKRYLFSGSQSSQIHVRQSRMEVNTTTNYMFLKRFGICSPLLWSLF